MRKGVIFTIKGCFRSICNHPRKGVIFTIRGCLRSICNHPFLVFLLCVLIFMYRSSSFMFSLLVSASPVLVCTAVLLGTLLFFGQPNVPEIEIEEKTTPEVVQTKNELSKDSIIVEKNESYYVERYGEKSRDDMEQPTVGSSLLESKHDEICREASVDDVAPLNKKRPGQTESDNDKVLEANRELDKKIEKQKAEWSDERFSDGEVMENHYASIPKVNDLESEYEKSEAESFDSEMVNVDSLESPSRSAWKQVKHQEDEEEEEDDDALDSGSDGAESSSPDASMADMIPMLDELHPLLDEEVAQPVQMSRLGSEAASEQSPRSSTSSIESVDETENQEDSEVPDDDDDDAQGDKEDQSKSAIIWTEEDKKNLMDVGSSEIERNQRLENLILRRRTLKNMSMVPEINLIDLESSDFPYHIAHISTTRQNPFDLPHDSYVYLGLPPIPGSAPSILLPRRNPFDVPYELSEGKPNLMGDGFQEELKTSQSREPFFRRRESFNVGPSIFAPNRQERQDLKWRPYFVSERMVLEESSYSTLQRQSSEMSDSKGSSVPETESVSSVEDVEDQKLEQEDDTHELEILKRELSEEDTPYEPEVISEMKQVGRESQSSEGEECLELGVVEKRDIEVNDLKFQSQDVEDHYEAGTVAQHGYNSFSEVVEQRPSRGSSTSSLSEVSERVFTKIDGEGSSMLDGINYSVAVGPDISRQTSDMTITSTLVDDVPHKEPVYDSSPPTERQNLSSSSTSSDVHVELDPSFPPVLVKRTVSESQEIEKDICTDQQSRVNRNLGVEYSIDEEETVLSPNSDVDYHEANEKLISTPTAGGSTSHFHDRLLHERDFEHLEEVQVPNTPVESCEKVRTINNLHIPELHKLDHDVSPSIKPPSIPDVISKPSSVSDESISHIGMQTKQEEADEIKEIDERLLSELDSVGDFSIMHQGSGSLDLEKHVDFAGKRLSSLHACCTETSNMNVGEVKLNTDARLVEVKEESEESSVRELNSVTAGKPDDEAKMPEDARSTTSDKEKENSSKSSSSSSSSSSESSSSDSEEKKKVIISAKRRLSTPF